MNGIKLLAHNRDQVLWNAKSIGKQKDYVICVFIAFFLVTNKGKVFSHTTTFLNHVVFSKSNHGTIQKKNVNFYISDVGLSHSQ